MKLTEFEETIKKFSAIQNYAPFVTFFFLNGSHLTLRTFKQYVVKYSSGNENVRKVKWLPFKKKKVTNGA